MVVVIRTKLSLSDNHVIMLSLSQIVLYVKYYHIVLSIPQ